YNCRFINVVPTFGKKKGVPMLT
ncbi:hypothetical protein DBR06_SOUSAS24110019, partial [Sousa chinensis]